MPDKKEKNEVPSDFFLEGGGTFPENSYKPSYETYEKRLLANTDKQIHRQTSFYFIIRIWFKVIHPH